MVTTKRADQLQVGDVFSTDGYRVRSARVLHDGRVSVECWLDASGGISKYDVLDADHPCPIYTEDDEVARGMSTGLASPGLSAEQLSVILRMLEDSGYLRVPIVGQFDNGTVQVRLGGKGYSVDVFGNTAYEWQR